MKKSEIYPEGIPPGVSVFYMYLCTRNRDNAVSGAFLLILLQGKESTPNNRLAAVLL